MLITTIQNATIRTATYGNTLPQANGDRFVLGRMSVQPPAEFLSQGRTFLPPLPTPEPKPGRKDDGEPNLRYPESPAPAGSVGSVPGSPVCRTARTARLTRTPRAEVVTAILESKMDPFGRRCDCQSLRGMTDLHTGLKANPSWPQDAVPAATAAAQ